MHIPDGFLSPPVWSAFDALAIPAVAIVARRAQQDVEDRNIPLMGVMGAFVFAAQMINFPVGLGTSGHLVGGTLLAVVLGPAAAVLVMTAIVAIQALVFQDGGIIALGANVFNMALVGVMAGWLPYRLCGRRWRAAAISCGASLSVLASGCLALAELRLSHVPVTRNLMLVSLGFFFIGALAEGAITVAAVRAIERLNPSAIRSGASPGSPAMAALAMAAIVLAAGGILVASSAPDGIERLLSVHAGDQTPWVRKAGAGIGGLALIYAACAGTGRLLRRNRSA